MNPRLVCYALVVSGALTACGGSSKNRQQSPASVAGASGAPDAPGPSAGGAGGAPSGCEPPLVTCEEGACVDVATDPAHCGACDASCATGASCEMGECVCPEGQLECAGACVDPTSDALHCGGCEESCSVGNTCMAAACTHADACSTPALGVTVRKLDLYQTVLIPLLDGEVEVPLADRSADVVAGADGLLRVFADTYGDWTPRELSARLQLKEPGQPPTEIFQKLQVFGPSTEDALSNFAIVVPPGLLSAETSYRVELADCAEASGDELSPRFPAKGHAALGARTVGDLKVHLVPLDVGQVPNLSPERLTYLETYLEALLPVANVQLTVGEVYVAGTTLPTFDEVLDKLLALRAAEAPGDDVYYMGVSPVQASQGEDGLAFEIGPDEVDLRVAAFVNLESDAAYSAAVLAHELGHNHGIAHAPGCGADSADFGYPHPGALIGSFGYDSSSNQFRDPSVFYDVMSYCKPQWISRYNYQYFLERIALVNGLVNGIKAPVTARREPAWSGRTLIVRASGETMWGRPFHGRPGATRAELASVLDAGGRELGAVTVYRITTGGHGSTFFVVPNPEPEWFAIRLAGAAAVAFESQD